MRFRFLHASDLHLDSPFEGIGGAPPDVAARLRDASLEALDRLTTLALEREVAFVLLAGDLYDGPERGLRAQLRFLRAVERLGGAGIPVFVVHGNHDPAGGWSAFRALPPNLKIFPAGEVEAVPVERDGTTLATVYGISYGASAITENLALRFARADGRPGLHIGLLHAAVGAQADGNPYSPCTLADLIQAGMDYWALGHAHEYRVLSEAPWAVYPGTPQGRGTRPGEWWAKGCALAEATPERVESVEFTPLDSIRLVEAQVDIEGVQDVAGLSRRMLGEIRRLRETHAGLGLLVRVTLTGRGGVHRELQAPGRREDLLEDLRDQTAGSDPLIWVDDLVDDSRAMLDRDAVARRGDFLSDLLRRSEDLAADPDRLRARIAEAGLALSTSRFRAWLPDRGAWDPLALLKEAERRALDLLEGDTGS
jgi:DNA repair exonuclease SbcCD nuclease subunit